MSENEYTESFRRAARELAAAGMSACEAVRTFGRAIRKASCEDCRGTGGPGKSCRSCGGTGFISQREEPPNV